MSKPDDYLLFHQLKDKVAAKFLENNYASSPDIGAWKGQDIFSFQEDLLEKVNGRVSEKWFYTYFKGDPKKLPRIDMLNLLAAYVGYESWEAYRGQHTVNQTYSPKVVPKQLNRWTALISIVVIIILLGSYITYQNLSTDNAFHFCLLDRDRNMPINNDLVEIKLLRTGESPQTIALNEGGCFEWETRHKSITFVIQSSYYQNDTIRRHISQATKEIVKLNTDDYALMLHYYSNAKVEDWKKRRRQLHEIIDDNALIYQVFPHELGVEIFTKDEFINKLTTPTSTLKNIEIIETQYNGAKKIIKLRFKVHTK